MSMSTKEYRVPVYDENDRVIARVRYNADLDCWDGRNWSNGGLGNTKEGGCGFLVGHWDFSELQDKAQGSAPEQSDGSSGPEGGAAAAKGGDAGGEWEARAGTGSRLPASTQPPASSTQAAAPSQPASPVAGRAGGPESGARAQIPAPAGPSPAGGRCGSCATGVAEPWEDPAPPPEGGPEGVGKAEAEIIRRQVAQQIMEHSRRCGSVPGHLARWAEKKLSPGVDWRRELASAIRHAVADVAGPADYSYRRPSRRQGAVGNGVILPALRQPAPEVALVIDTSGSVSDEMLSQALAEIAGVLRAVGQHGVHVLAVDAAVQSSRRVFSASQVQLAGGGGTNMGAGISAAEKLRPRPEVCIIITDGYTPWPAERPRGMRVIVALLDNPDPIPAIPGWARVVRIKEKEGK